jgi:hypothetical protein
MLCAWDVGLQILCGGENVYSTEVEAVLAAHPAVAQAAVFGIPNVVLGELVAAAVVLKPGQAGTSGGQLMAWCRERLAHYKVPSQVGGGVGLWSCPHSVWRRLPRRHPLTQLSRPPAHRTGRLCRCTSWRRCPPQLPASS